MSLIIGFLDDWLSLKMLALVAAFYGVYKIRRARSIVGGVVGVAGTGVFTATVLVVAGGVAIAAGWLDPIAMASDLAAWIGALWGAIGDWVIGLVEEAVP